MPTSLTALRAAVVASLLATAPAFAVEVPAASVAASAAADSLRPTSARAARETADSLLQSGDLRRAQRGFLARARVVRKAGVLPVDELKSAAAAAYGRDHVLEAAWILDELAADAVAFGRPDVQAQALLDAASLYAAARQPERARERLATLRTVVSSPFVPESLRRQVAGLTQTASR